ncbi:MAG: 2,3-epoxybenzoyl-CoA dihydrolase [Planctomycetota bacterium]|nr:2,3-epoxybenzoyl-CoA dihydrolase [Planctomycetota bacterium]
MASTLTSRPPVRFQTHPSRYRHWKLGIEGDVATLTMGVDPQGGEREGYELKLNSYDLGVDIELADAILRLRFEHPEVRCVVITGALDRVFCAGANIVMLRSSTHGFKVNFCKYTNETRLGIEDASANSGMRFLAALNGTASGGGYELALACDEILLVDDRNSAVSFPEVPLLGVLPGTGGLTRIADKRKIRRDRCDVFSTIAEGIKGKRAVEWNLVDAIAPLSRWSEAVKERARRLADTQAKKSGPGIALEAIEPEETPTAHGRRFAYRYVEFAIDSEARTAELTITAPSNCPKDEKDARAEASGWWVLRAFRELDDAICRLRLNHSEIGLVLLRCKGPSSTLRATDALLAAPTDWFVREVANYVRRTLKRVDLSAKGLYAIADGHTTFVGTFLELLLSCDRSYAKVGDAEGATFGVTAVNAGTFPMSNGISRLATRFLGTPDSVTAVLGASGDFDAETADGLGLATFAPDGIDWDDELRLAIEERSAFSPDALTGMEANLRFAGPETMETKIFGRLSAWQNWIFQRPNAVGERGALTSYGTPNKAEFDFNRT